MMVCTGWSRRSLFAYDMMAVFSSYISFTVAYLTFCLHPSEGLVLIRKHFMKGHGLVNAIFHGLLSVASGI